MPINQSIHELTREAEPGIEVIEAPVNANVWKILVKEGEVLQKGQVVTILEAMKMEINVLADSESAGATVVKIVGQPGEGIAAGKPLMLVKRA